MSEPDDSKDMLDLARSYMAMGDSAGARELLAELAAQGVGEARRMLESTDADMQTESDEHAELEPRAKGGDAQAQYLLAQYYLRSRGVDGHFDLALRWFAAAAGQDHLDAMVNLGGLLARHSYNNPERKREGVAWLRRAADSGHAAAEHWLGTQLIKGADPAHFAEGFDYLQRAVQQGLPDAFHDLGRVLLNTEGPQADPALGLEWMNKAADAGYLPSLQALEWMYRKGTSVPLDLRRAAGYLERAADLGDYNASLELGNLLRSGIDGDPDFDGAEHWFLKAREHQQSYSDPYELRGLYRVAAVATPDQSRKTTWLRKGAEVGDGFCMFELGEALLAADPAEAAHWFRSAAATGDWTAMAKLADLYHQGRGVPQDLWSATFWHREAARCQSTKGDLRLLEARSRAAADDPALTESPLGADIEGPVIELGISFGWHCELGGLMSNENGLVPYEHVCTGIEVAPGLFRIVSLGSESGGLEAGDLVRTANGYGGKPYVVEVVSSITKHWLDGSTKYKGFDMDDC